ncbi:MAG: hypothetical protein A3F72_04155 [Bacteroidetes bacterium RIFCSPLOWO2_12_FULL_35_15]|nr:MAG: hypothetical protein A3F72_04155 [Bacteroidetes bacterium RIFCSPLOWO2_12_FULL_35_15]
METNPIPNIFFRIAGVISIISAILMIAGFFLHPSGEDATYGTDPLWVPAHALLWIVFIIALPAWVGIYIVHASKAGKIGIFSFIILLIRTGFRSSIFSSDVTFVPVIASEFPQLFKRIFTNSHIAIGIACVLTWVSGNVLFGISIIRSKVFSNRAALCLIVGTLIIPIAYLSGLPVKVVAIGATINGIGQIRLGYQIYLFGK